MQQSCTGIRFLGSQAQCSAIPCSLPCPTPSYNISALHCNYLWASYHSLQTVRSWRVRTLLPQQLVVWVSLHHLVMVLLTFITIRKKKREDFMKINHSFLSFSEKLPKLEPISTNYGIHILRCHLLQKTMILPSFPD